MGSLLAMLWATYPGGVRPVATRWFLGKEASRLVMEKSVEAIFRV